MAITNSGDKEMRQKKKQMTMMWTGGKKTKTIISGKYVIKIMERGFPLCFFEAQKYLIYKIHI